MSRIEKVIQSGTCLGCGLCEALGRSAGYQMRWDGDGFPRVHFPGQRSLSLEAEMESICPTIQVNGGGQSGIWGSYTSCLRGHAINPEIRHKGSSGGIVSALAIHLLETGEVQAVLQVGTSDRSPLENVLRVSRSREDVLECASSRYAPAVLFRDILPILDEGEDKFAFIGKPCDVQAMKALVAQRRGLAKRVSVFVAIVCAGIPSLNATKELFGPGRYDEVPLKVRYRGEGWPGKFVAQFQDGNAITHDYSDSWGRTLGKQLNFRCKICPDSVGLQADIVVGDAWESQDGYPDFEEKPGESFLLVRTAIGERVIQTAKGSASISVSDWDPAILAATQRYQSQRRSTALYRVLGAQLRWGVFFRFRRFKFPQRAGLAGVIEGLRTMKGTFSRAKRNLGKANVE